MITTSLALYALHYISGFFIIMSTAEGLHFSALVLIVDRLIDSSSIQYYCLIFPPLTFAPSYAAIFQPGQVLRRQEEALRMEVEVQSTLAGKCICVILCRVP